MHRVLGAVKQAEMARLAALRQAAAAARAQAGDLRHRSVNAAPGETAADMLATSSWQNLAHAKARDADALAREIDEAARPHEAALARAIGQEIVVDGMLDLAALESRRRADLRAESGAS